MTILNEFSYIVGYNPGWDNGWFSIVSLIATIIGFIGIVICIIRLDFNKTFLNLASVCFSLGLIMFLLSCFTAHPYYETRYEVIIDNAITFNEVLNKYEIVDQRGSIYTLREIDEEIYFTPIEE